MSKTEILVEEFFTEEVLNRLRKYQEEKVECPYCGKITFAYEFAYKKDSIIKEVFYCCSECCFKGKAEMLMSKTKKQLAMKYIESLEIREDEFTRGLSRITKILKLSKVDREVVK